MTASPFVAERSGSERRVTAMCAIMIFGARTSQGERMSVDVTTETIIDRTVGEVADFVANPANAPTWYKNIKSVEWETAPPLQIGSKLEFVAHFLGRRLAYTYEVVAYDPGERLVMTTAQGPFPMETTYTWETTAEGATRMRLRNRGTPSGFSRMAAPMMGMAVRRANNKDLARLKELLERHSESQ